MFSAKHKVSSKALTHFLILILFVRVQSKNIILVRASYFLFEPVQASGAASVREPTPLEFPVGIGSHHRLLSRGTHFVQNSLFTLLMRMKKNTSSIQE